MQAMQKASLPMINLRQKLTSYALKVIITALEELIRKSKISGLKAFKGKVDLDINMNDVRGRQCR